MGSAPLPYSRLAGVALIVFLANAAMLVLQLVAGRLLAPFIGSSLETWTSVIGVFLTGIALGNGFGGKLADRYPSPRTLAGVLILGAATALWMAVFPWLLETTGAHKVIPLGPRIPLLALILCLPAGFVLSLLTPLAIKLGLPDVSKTGRVAGMVFSVSTLGCLLGNYLTGFVLFREFTINTLVFASAVSLALLALWSLVSLRETPLTTGQVPVLSETGEAPVPVPTPNEQARNPHAFTDIRVAFAVVFLASFGGMTLELTASRVLAQFLGVSLFTWTGIIGVMLAGTAMGNFTGGLVADRVNRPGTNINPRAVLACTLMIAGGFAVFVLIGVAILTREVFTNPEPGPLDDYGPISTVMICTFSLFFAPMFFLGMVSPQVIRLAVPDVQHAGSVAGRVYAWSTTGAIVGTFVAGYLMLSTFGMYNTLLVVALVLTLTCLLFAEVWDDNLMLYMFSIVLGAVTGGFILNVRTAGRDEHRVALVETNYYTIKVTKARNVYGYYTGTLTLTLDALIHSSVDPDDPKFLYYEHEHVQMEFLRLARASNPNPRVLVIGGGGYTFPRYAMEVLPETRMDVVEIDPGVTKVARDYLGLQPYDGLDILHMDGRQFVAERVPPGTYDLVIQDAVNDLSVPSHLLTKEYNDAVKRVMKPNGVYLLTVIDAIEYGKLWKAAFHTLQKSYPAENIALLTPGSLDLSQRQVYILYASDAPFDPAALRNATGRGIFPAFPHADWGQPGPWPSEVIPPFATVLSGAALAKEPRNLFFTRRVPAADIQPYLDAEAPVILTDQFAPTDNLMADVFRYRHKRPKRDDEE